MSILAKLEEHAEHLLLTMKQIMQHQIEAMGGASDATKEIVETLEQHIESKKVDFVRIVAETPVVQAPAVQAPAEAPVVQAPVEAPAVQAPVETPIIEETVNK